jgi:hypothetical protein
LRSRNRQQRLQRYNATRCSLKLLSDWLPLNDVTLQNGCMYAVPRGQDTDFADPGNAAALQEPKVPVDGLTALAPHPAGSFLCWSGNTIHWGSGCAREGAADPRTSLALVFRRVSLAGGKYLIIQPLIQLLIQLSI